MIQSTRIPSDQLRNQLVAVGMFPDDVQRVAIRLGRNNQVTVMEGDRTSNITPPALIHQALTEMWMRLSVPRDHWLALQVGAAIEIMETTRVQQWVALPASAQNQVLMPAGVAGFVDPEAPVPLTSTLDARILYARMPSGIAVVGLSCEDGQILIYDGQQEHGETDAQAAPTERVVQHVLMPLLEEAERCGRAAVIVDVRTHQSWGVTMSVLLQAVTAQRMPMTSAMAMSGLTATVHPLVQGVAVVAASWAMAPDRFRRAIAAVMCLIAGFMSIFSFWLLYRMGVAPIYEVLGKMPVFEIFDAPEQSLTMKVGGHAVVVTVLLVLSWSFTIFELVGIMFGSITPVRRFLYGVAIVDALLLAIYYFMQMVPTPETMAAYPLVVRGLLYGSNALGALLLGVLTGWFWEVIALVSLVMTIVLSPALGWFVSACVRSIGRAGIACWFVVVATLGDWQGTWHDGQEELLRKRGYDRGTITMMAVPHREGTGSYTWLVVLLGIIVCGAIVVGFQVWQ